MELAEFGSLTQELRHQLEGDEEDPFDSAGIGLEYRSKESHVGLKDEHGSLVASTGMLVVEVEVRGARFEVVGLGGVIVSARHRGRGLGLQVMQAALAKATTLGPAFAMLFCHKDRAGLYRRLGFAEVIEEVTVQQPGGIAPMPQQTMWRALRHGAQWPDGPVVVHSLPF